MTISHDTRYSSPHILPIFHRFYIRDEEAHQDSLHCEPPRGTHINTTRMLLIALTLILILGVALIIAQPDDVRVNIFSITRTVNISSAEVKPKLPGARTVNSRRNTINVHPRM